jgi:hypothetical protein
MRPGGRQAGTFLAFLRFRNTENARTPGTSPLMLALIGLDERRERYTFSKK